MQPARDDIEFVVGKPVAQLAVQFAQQHARPLERRMAFVGQVQPRCAAVVRIGMTRDEAGFRHPVGKARHRGRRELQRGADFTDQRTILLRETEQRAGLRGARALVGFLPPCLRDLATSVLFGFFWQAEVFI